MTATKIYLKSETLEHLDGLAENPEPSSKTRREALATLLDRFECDDIRIAALKPHRKNHQQVDVVLTPKLLALSELTGIAPIELIERIVHAAAAQPANSLLERQSEVGISTRVPPGPKPGTPASRPLMPPPTRPAPKPPLQKPPAPPPNQKPPSFVPLETILAASRSGHLPSSMESAILPPGVDPSNHKKWASEKIVPVGSGLPPGHYDELLKRINHFKSIHGTPTQSQIDTITRDLTREITGKDTE